MWRRGSSVSQLISSSKSSYIQLNQASYGLKIWEALSTEELKQEALVVEKVHKCSKIVEAFGFTHLSADDLLSKEISSNSENGAMILSTIKKGKIVI